MADAPNTGSRTIGYAVPARCDAISRRMNGNQEIGCLWRKSTGGTAVLTVVERI
jgi:hypothetical protein